MPGSIRSTLEGALVVRNSSSWVLDRKYYGGGTVAASTAREPFCALKANLSERFEDGTLPYLDIVSLRHGFDALEKLAGGMARVSSHTFLVAQYFARSLRGLAHSNGLPLAQLFLSEGFCNPHTQGPIVNFCLRRPTGEYVGFAEVDKLAQLHDIHLRTGCFCNIGACQRFLLIADHTIKDNLHAGHVCGDDKDLIDGRPTGSIRVSFGYMSAITDAVRCLDFLAQCFLDRTPKPVFTAPNWFQPPRELVDDASEKTKSSSTTWEPEDCPSAFEKTSPAVDLGPTIHKAEGSLRTDVDALGKVSTASSSKRDKQSVDVAEEMNRESVEAREGGEEEEKRRVGVPRERFGCSEKHRVLTDIFLYPVKSCGAFRVEEWELGEKGLQYDRTWMIVSQTGVALSQKREPRLCLLKPLVHLRSAILELTFPGMTSYSVPLVIDDAEDISDVNICTSKICNDRVRSQDCGAGVAQWLCQALQRPGLRLLRQLDQDCRQSRRKDLTGEGTQASTDKAPSTTTTTPTTSSSSSSSTGTLSLANESQYLVISRESVRSLAKKLSETREDLHTEQKDSHPDHLPDYPEYLDEDNLVERFRANLVIDGGLSFDEDSWTRIMCGDIHFVGQGQCSRCGMICLSQTTGEKTREPLRTLASWRGGKVYFGVYMRKLDSETRPLLKVGTTITVD